MAEGCRGSEFRLHVQAAHHRYSTVRLKSRLCFFDCKFQTLVNSGENALGQLCLSVHAYCILALRIRIQFGQWIQIPNPDPIPDPERQK